MRLNFTTKDLGDIDLVDDALSQLRYTVRSSADGKTKTVRRPAQELHEPDPRGIFIARFYFHTIGSDKILLKDGEYLNAKEWMQDEGNGYAASA